MNKIKINNDWQCNVWLSHFWLVSEILQKQAEKLKSCEMKDKWWVMNNEGWRYQVVVGFDLWQTDKRMNRHLWLYSRFRDWKSCNIIGGWVVLDYNITSGPFFELGDWDWTWTRTRAWHLPLNSERNYQLEVLQLILVYCICIKVKRHIIFQLSLWVFVVAEIYLIMPNSLMLPGQEMFTHVVICCPVVVICM